MGVSGFAGAGKTTMAHRLVDEVGDGLRLRADDYLDPVRAHRPSSDWALDRDRLKREVVVPFRTGKPVMIRRLDWATRQLGAPTPLPRVSVLVVEGVGLFHPDLLESFDLTVWVDVDLQTARRRGRSRGRWNRVWTTNDRTFEHLFHPRDGAGLRYVPSDLR